MDVAGCGLRCRLDREVVDVHVRRPGDDIGDSVGDVLGGERVVPMA
jgi:hypothetical protein